MLYRVVEVRASVSPRRRPALVKGKYGTRQSALAARAAMARIIQHRTGQAPDLRVVDERGWDLLRELCVTHQAIHTATPRYRR